MTNKYASSSPLPIGQIIKQELSRRKRTVTWLAREVNCDRRNIYDIFSRADIDTALLFRISRALNFDFFALYSRELHLADHQTLTPPLQHHNFAAA